MNQLNLFETTVHDGVIEYQTPISRRDDKETSKQAEREIAHKLNGLRKEFVLKLIELNCPSTANEVARGVESVRKRAGECVEAGWLSECGKKVCNVTGKTATAYWLSPGFSMDLLTRE